MNINVFLQVTGHHEAAWRMPESDVGAAYDLGHWTRLARTAERGKLDSIFFGDTASLPLGDIRYRPGGRMDPVLILAALAAATERIGLVATASTTFNHPFTLARQFATLDHLSGGRAGWNIVTSADTGSAENFGLEEIPDHAERYARATEFLEVAGKLWNSWDENFLVADKENGVYADGDKIRSIDHEGRFFKVKGPMNMPRPPQGRPLLVQAGTSEAGLAFAADAADAVFTAMQTFEESRASYARLKTLVSERGRDPRVVKVLPGIVPFIGSTMDEALAAERRLGEWTRVENGLAQLNTFLQLSLGVDDLERKLLDTMEPGHLEKVGSRSRAELIAEMARRGDLTVRQTVLRMAGGRGHQVVVGTPEMIADHLEHWFRNEAADGFNLMPPLLPDGLDLFVDHVVPLLQARGLFRTEYAHRTLRENVSGS